MILGVTGPYAAGKGEAVAFLRARSFHALSLSDVVREELRARGKQETRERMIERGRALRADHGPAVLAERVIARLPADRNVVIDSIRHPAETDALRRLESGFRLIWIDAKPEIRLARLRARRRTGDPTSLKQLRALEEREFEGTDPSGQQLAVVRAQADFHLENDASLDDLHEALQRVLEACLHFERPGWDRYFMSIAQVVASRSNCVKRKVAAVITKDRRIISTGYNGTPRGVRNCNEGGCPRCNAFAQAGARLAECLCSHGEENAITQAAYHGVSVRGATLYTTLCPCLTCTKLIINAGISEVVYNAAYVLDEVALALLHEASVSVRRVALAD